MDKSSLAHTRWESKHHIHMFVRIPTKYSVSEIMG